MPKVWTKTIEEHRRLVRDATLDATAELVAAHGLASVTMTQIAKKTGIGRATLYKYFPDVESILLAWHERQVNGHLQHLAAIRNNAADPVSGLEAVLTAYAVINHGHHGTQLATMLHRGEHVAKAEGQLHDFLRELLVAGARAGQIRDDIAATELASYCLHALTAATDLPSTAGVHRLVDVTMAGLRPPR